MVSETEEISLEEAVTRVPFTVLAPTHLPWPRAGTFPPRVLLAQPLDPRYFFTLNLCYFPPASIVSITESSVHPSLHPIQRPNASENESIEHGERVIHLVLERGEKPGYAYFEQGGTHVEVFSKLGRLPLLEFIDSFAPPERKTEWITGASEGFARPDYELTQGAKLAVHRAYREAVRLDLPHVGVEHLLLALVEGEDGEVAEILQSLGSDRNALLAAVRGLIASGSAPRRPVRVAVERGIAEVRSLGQAVVGTRHLLLGLLLGSDGPVLRLLREAGLEETTLRRAILDHQERGGREAL